MLKRAKRIARRALEYLPPLVNRYEYAHQVFEQFNERPVEYAFVFRSLARLYPRDVLDVGTGRTALPHLMRTCGHVVTAIDNVKDYWPAGMINRHYRVLDDDITHPTIGRRFDLITCVSTLEHIEEADAAMRGMFSLLRPGGHLVLTCPYTEHEYVRNVYDLPDSSYGQDKKYITQSFSRTNLETWLAGNSASIVTQEYWQYWEGGAWTVGKQVVPPRESSASGSHQLTCMLLRKDSTSGDVEKT